MSLQTCTRLKVNLDELNKLKYNINDKDGLNNAKTKNRQGRVVN